MSTTSWQTSPSAKYYNCVSPNSPGSPVASPSSPTLYQVAQDDGLFVQNGGTRASGLSKNDGSTTASNRSQLATTLLKSLEEYQHLEEFQIQNGLGTDWSEENVNLELFNELSALEYTPPAVSPLDDFEKQTNFGEDLEVSIESENENELLDELSAEFIDIINSLPRTARADDIGDDLIDFADLIYSSPAETQGHQPTALAAILPSAMVGKTAGEEEVIDVSDSSTDESENEEDMFMETDVAQAASELGASFQYLTPEESSILSYSSLSMSEDESSMLSDEKMLDALLVGNLDEAVTFMPGVLLPLYTSEDSIKEIKIQPKEQRKPTKGGRKATNQRRKKTPKIEKIIRKKEQNKTAALRYRMKKKVEVEVTLEREAELQADHDNLMKEKNELAKEIQMVKQLLKAVFSNRKSKLQTLKKF